MEKEIQNNEDRIINIEIKSEICNPRKKIKKVKATSKKTVLYDVFDTEDNDEKGRKEFESHLKDLKESSVLKRGIDYRLAYSNYTFELWILLHKINVGYLGSKSNYLDLINSNFGVNLKSHKELTQEKNLNLILSRINLSEVKDAIDRASRIEGKNNKEKPLIQYCGYSYYKDNPALTVHLLVKDILKSAGL